MFNDVFNAFFLLLLTKNKTKFKYFQIQVVIEFKSTGMSRDVNEM